MVGSTDTLLAGLHRRAPGLEDSGFARGSILAPSWAVALVGGSVVLSGVLYFAWRLRRAKRTTRFSHPPAKR
jgi:hypothetical protein